MPCYRSRQRRACAQKSAQSRARGSQRTSDAEPLEPRLLLSDVTVNGTAGDDSFVARHKPGAAAGVMQVLLNGVVAGEGTPARFPGPGVDRMFVNGLGGNDTLL